MMLRGVIGQLALPPEIYRLKTSAAPGVLGCRPLTSSTAPILRSHYVMDLSMHAAKYFLATKMRRGFPPLMWPA
jgi:hypothetical protein